MFASKDTNKLIDAAGSGDLDTVQRLLETGLDVNVKLKDGFTALMAAITSGHTEVVKALLTSGADSNLRDDHGMTPLMMAAGKGRIEIVNALIKGGANIYAQNTSNSQLRPFRFDELLTGAVV
jgi:ankyrin repeat protein